MRPDPLDLGTQISRSMTNPQSWNLYAYVNNNPVNFNDPTGLMPPFGSKQEVEAAAAIAKEMDPQGVVADFTTETAGDLLSATDVTQVGSATAEAFVSGDATTTEKVQAVATDAGRLLSVGGLAKLGLSFLTKGASLVKQGVQKALAKGTEKAAEAKVWPKTPGEMNKMLKMEGTPVADTPSTPGRGKVNWTPNQETKITFEQHPYHSNAPNWHQGPHWHLDTPAGQHVRYVPGDAIPGY